MSMHRLWWSAMAFAVACGGDDATNADSDGSTGGGSGTSNGTVDGSASASTSTSTSTTNSTSTTAGTTATTGESSGDSDSGAQTTSGADGSSSETTASSTGASEGSTGESTSGGACEPLPDDDGWPCMNDDDCEIAGDCCSCTAYNPDMGAPGNCGGGCGQNVCEQLGLDMAVCVGGFCEVYGLSCDQTAVSCDSLPPDCAAGTLPQVGGGCWTNECLPIEYCDWVPDCGACPGDQFCVIVQTQACDHVDCFDPIRECGLGAPSCDCEGQLFCPAPFTDCAIENGAVVCS